MRDDRDLEAREREERPVHVRARQEARTAGAGLGDHQGGGPDRGHVIAT